MLTRRAFVGGAVGLAAGAARAAPIPAGVRRQPGIVVSTWSNDIAFLDDEGRVIRRVAVAGRLGRGWRPDAVNHDGTVAAVTGPVAPGTDGLYPLVALPLSDERPPRPVLTPASRASCWSWDGAAVIADRGYGSNLFGFSGYTRTVRVDPAAGRWVDLPMPVTPVPGVEGPVSRHSVRDWSADGRWFLTQFCGFAHEERPLHLVSVGDLHTVRLTTPGEQIDSARLSPDGLRLLVWRQEYGPRRSLAGARVKQGVLEVRGVGGGVTEIGRWVIPDYSVELGHIRGWYSACWRADGRRVACLIQSGDAPHPTRFKSCPTGQIVAFDPDGGNRHVVASWAGWGYYQLLGWA